MILVTAATGNVGSATVAALVARGLAVRAASRAATPVAGAEAVALDLADPATWEGALGGVRGTFLLIPPGLGGRPLLPFLARARGFGAGPFAFLSVQGAESSRLVPHRAVEDALTAGPRDWTILRPGFFAQNLGDAYGRDIRDDSRLHVPAGRARVAWTDARDLGEVAATALAEPEAHAGAAYPLTGAESLSFAEAAAIMSDTLGRPVRYEPAGALGYLRHLRRRGTPWVQALVYLRLHVGLRWGEGDRPTPDLGRLLGRAPRTLGD